jgi:biopolymer transport protein ExbD
MRRFRSQSWQIEEPSINLTPLIDVVFVILIMFIVIAPLLDIDRIELAGASKEAGKKSVALQESSQIAIQVFGDNSIQFNQKEVELKDLSFLLSEAKKKYPDVKPQLFHDKRAFFGTYQSVKNSVEEAGFQQMDIILQPG